MFELDAGKSKDEALVRFEYHSFDMTGALRCPDRSAVWASVVYRYAGSARSVEHGTRANRLCSGNDFIGCKVSERIANLTLRTASLFLDMNRD